MSTIREISVAEAKKTLPALLRSVENGECSVVITRHGMPVAAINRAGPIESPEFTAWNWTERMQQLHQQAILPL